MIRFVFIVSLILFIAIAAKPLYASTIKINEFSSASNPEWVELYNTGTSEINLNDWQILFHDNPSTTQKITLSPNDTISPGRFKIVERSYTGSSAWLSNSGDAIILKDSTNGEQDSVRYGNVNGSVVDAPTSVQSAGRSTDGISGWIIFLTPTKGATNNTSVSTSTPSPTPTLTPSPTPTPTSSTTQSTSSFTISNIPSQIDSDQSFNVSINLTLPDNPSTNFYLKGAFKKADGSNYFGQTKVSGNWVKNSSTYSNQYLITTNSSGNWSGNLEIQPDTDDSGYTGSNDYTFKVGKYTSAGSGPAWSNESTIKIISTESSDPASTTSTSNNPSATTNPSASSQSVKSQAITSSQPKTYDRLVYRIASVAAATASATPSAKVEVSNQKQTNPIVWVGLIFVFAGAGLIGYIYLKRNAKIHI